jgi:hypothetical protein
LSTKETPQGYLNFAEISNSIQFEDVLNWLNIPFEDTKKELRGDGFIINKEKNLFFAPENDEQKGSVINFLSYYKSIPLRDAAAMLKLKFLSKEKEHKPKRSIPDLKPEWHPYLHDRGITPEIASEYEVGYINQRSVVAGRIAFKVHDHNGNLAGYIGYKEETGDWYVPKGFKRPLFGSYRLKDKKYVIVTTDPFDALKIASCGLVQVVSLLNDSMSKEQEEELKKYRYIYLLHPKPANIIARLYETSFVRAPLLSKTIQEMTKEEIQNIKPSQK